MTTITTIAGAAGRITGTAARGLIWAHQTIDWAEVGAIVLQGLQILIVLTLLAGRATRRAWDALLGWSERLGRWYGALVAPATKQAEAASAPVITREHQARRWRHQGLTQQAIANRLGCSRTTVRRLLAA